VPRERHQYKEVEKALQYAESKGCTVEVKHAGHVWGHALVPNGQRLVVFSTPKDQDNAAKIIRRFVDKNTAKPKKEK
jgi:lysophospholipid acyltransferase (LPLAT)-like uncharacterized protein